jgi:hypothetical protein
MTASVATTAAERPTPGAKLQLDLVEGLTRSGRPTVDQFEDAQPRFDHVLDQVERQLTLKGFKMVFTLRRGGIRG